LKLGILELCFVVTKTVWEMKCLMACHSRLVFHILLNCSNVIVESVLKGLKFDSIKW
jgi:hypothetical protein